MADKKKKSCFIITPIGNERDPIMKIILTESLMQ